MSQEQFSTHPGALDGLALGKPLNGTEGVGQVGQFGLQDNSIGSTGSGLTEAATHHHGHSGTHHSHNHPHNQTEAATENVGHVGMFGLEDKSIGSTGSGLTESVTHHHGHSAHAGQHQHGHQQGSHLQHEPLDPAVAAGMGAGHHDKDPLPAIHGSGSGSNSSSHPIADKYTTGYQQDSAAHNAAIGAGALGVGAGAAGAAGVASQTQTHHEEAPAAIEGDVYGKSGGMNEYSDKGIAIHDDVKGASGSTTADSSRGAGLGLASAGAATAGAGVAGAGLAGKSTSDPNDPISAIKQELKDNQAAGSHSTHDAETKGPHGLVWSDADGGKYVHQRELDGKGSTGVDLSGTHARE